MNLISEVGPLGHRGYRGGHHPGMFILGCLLLVAVVVLALLLYNQRRRPALASPPPSSPAAAAGTQSVSAGAEAILAERLARGEVSIEEFTAARAALRE